jgi:hypothetical protein
MRSLLSAPRHETRSLERARRPSSLTEAAARSRVSEDLRPATALAAAYSDLIRLTSVLVYVTCAVACVGSTVPTVQPAPKEHRPASTVTSLRTFKARFRQGGDSLMFRGHGILYATRNPVRVRLDYLGIRTSNRAAALVRSVVYDGRSIFDIDLKARTISLRADVPLPLTLAILLQEESRADEQRAILSETGSMSLENGMSAILLPDSITVYYSAIGVDGWIKMFDVKRVTVRDSWFVVRPQAMEGFTLSLDATPQFPTIP